METIKTIQKSPTDFMAEIKREREAERVLTNEFHGDVNAMGLALLDLRDELDYLCSLVKQAYTEGVEDNELNQELMRVGKFPIRNWETSKTKRMMKYAV